MTITLTFKKAPDVTSDTNSIAFNFGPGCDMTAVKSTPTPASTPTPTPTLTPTPTATATATSTPTL